MIVPFYSILLSILYLILFFSRPYLRKISIIVLTISLIVFIITGILFDLADANIFNSIYLSPPVFDFIGLILIIIPPIFYIKSFKK